MRLRIEVLEFMENQTGKLMENQTGRKVKELSYDHVEEFMNSFLKFGQNNGIMTHFTNEKDGLAKKMNRALLEKVWYLLYNASLDKSFWAEVIVHTSHLLNSLPTTAIGGKTPLKIWSCGAARYHGSLRVFDCPTYIDVKKDMLDFKVNKLVFLGYKEDLKGYKLWDPKNKEFVSSRHVTLDEALMVKPTISQQVEIMKIKSEVSQRVEVDATSHCPVGSVSSGFHRS